MKRLPVSFEMLLYTPRTQVVGNRLAYAHSPIHSGNGG